MTILEFLKADLPSSEAKIKIKEGLPSNEAKARIKNGLIKINGEVVKDFNFEVGEPIVADKVLETLTKEQLSKVAELRIVLKLKFEELFGINFNEKSLVYDLFVNHICIKVSKTDFYIAKV